MVWRLLLITSLLFGLSGCISTGYITNKITEFPDGSKTAECAARYFSTRDSKLAQLSACGGAIRVDGAITSDVMLKLLDKAIEARNGGLITPL